MTIEDLTRMQCPLELCIVMSILLSSLHMLWLHSRRLSSNITIRREIILQ